MNSVDVCSYFVPDGGKCHYYMHEGLCARSDKFRCPVYELLFLGKISVSEANAWKRCHHSWKLSYMNGIQVLPEMKSKPVKIGSAVAKGLEQIHTSGSFNEECFSEFTVDEEKEKLISKVLLDKLATFEYEHPCRSEFEFHINIPDVPIVHGFMDCLYVDHFDEYKVTSKPDYYLNPHFIQSQIGAYFLYSKDLEYCNMKVIRTPALKSIGQYKDEDAFTHAERVKEDIDRRTSYYFIGYDKDKNTFGKRYYRTEFNLNEVVARFKQIVKEKRLAIKEGVFYKDEAACLVPGPCQFLPVCESGGVSDLVYQMRKK